MLEDRDSGLGSPEVGGSSFGESKSVRCWKSSSFKIYLGHTLSSWGDRMWGFAVGLYMVILFPDSLLVIEQRIVFWIQSKRYEIK
jgi:hypothetical protein